MHKNTSNDAMQGIVQRSKIRKKAFFTSQHKTLTMNELNVYHIQYFSIIIRQQTRYNNERDAPFSQIEPLYILIGNKQKICSFIQFIH